MPGSPRPLLLRSSSRRLRLVSRSEARPPQAPSVMSQSPSLGGGQGRGQAEAAPPGGCATRAQAAARSRSARGRVRVSAVPALGPGGRGAPQQAHQSTLSAVPGWPRAWHSAWTPESPSWLLLSCSSRRCLFWVSIEPKWWQQAAVRLQDFTLRAADGNWGHRGPRLWGAPGGPWGSERQPPPSLCPS